MLKIGVLVMNNLKFSVLISVYKKESPLYFKECMESILLNSVIPDEIVIVEDGELTEELYNVINQFECKYENIIKRVPLDKNVGLGQALNKGLEKCSYNLVARMDADDICAPNRFEIQIAEFQKDSELILLGSYINEFDRYPEEVNLARKVPLEQSEIIKFAKIRNPFNHMTVMFRKDKILEVGSYRKVFDIGYEDYDLWVRVLKAGYKAKNLDIPLVYVRTGKAMLKRRGNKKRLRTALYFRKHLKDIGFINSFEFIVYSLLTIIFSFSPIILKGWLYKNILRSEAQS